jgi:phosphopantothenoylcysteine synthetase/decarboxylase
MKIVVTCGPSYEPLDEVRRITNFSTGELGVMLTNHLARAGHELICMKGIGATCPVPVEKAQVVPFTTNDDLCRQLCEIPEREKIGAVFHAAALGDFKIAKVTDGNSQPLDSRKISSQQTAIHLVLEPAPKLIFKLRNLFPNSWIIGWKYELVGTREEALAKARTQISANHTTACVVNGTAYGDGFGFCKESGSIEHLPDKRRLCEFLVSCLAKEATE